MESLRRKAGLWRGTLDALPGPVVVVDADLKSITPQWIKHLGEPPVPKQLEELRQAKEAEAAADKAVKAALGLE